MNRIAVIAHVGDDIEAWSTVCEKAGEGYVGAASRGIAKLRRHLRRTDLEITHFPCVDAYEEALEAMEGSADTRTPGKIRSLIGVDREITIASTEASFKPKTP